MIPTLLPPDFVPAVDAPPNSLDPHETKAQVSFKLPPPADQPCAEFAVEPIDDLEECFRHSGWRSRRLQVWDALQRTHQNRGRLDRFRNCGSAAYLFYSPCRGALSVRANYCHDRFCIPCANARASRIARNLTRHVEARKLVFLTLTIRHNTTKLRDQIARIYECFKLLRRRVLWKQAEIGGAAFLELKVARDGLWHPHIHCIMESRFMPAKELSQAWLAVTGDSSVLDIRQVKSAEEVASYCVKYATKPADASIFNNAEMLDECVSTLKGVRFCLTWGTWRKLKLEDPDDGKPDDWLQIGRFSVLMHQANAGNPEAAAWIHALANGLRDSQPPPLPDL